MGIQVQPCCCPDPHHFFLLGGGGPLRCYNDLEEDPDDPGYWSLDWILGTPDQIAAFPDRGRVVTNPTWFTAFNFDVVGVGQSERILVMCGGQYNIGSTNHYLATIRPDGTDLSIGAAQGVGQQVIGPIQVDYARRRTYFVQMQPPGGGPHVYDAWQAPYSLKVAANLTDAAATVYTWSTSELLSFYGMVYVPEQDSVFLGVVLYSSSVFATPTNVQVHKVTAGGAQSVIVDIAATAGGDRIPSIGHDPITGQLYFMYMGGFGENPRIYRCNYDGSGLTVFAGPFNPASVVIPDSGPIQVDVSGRRILYARRAPLPAHLQMYYREIGGPTSILLYDQPPMLMDDTQIQRFVFGRGFVEIDEHWGG